MLCILYLIKNSFFYCLPVQPLISILPCHTIKQVHNIQINIITYKIMQKFIAEKFSHKIPHISFWRRIFHLLPITRIALLIIAGLLHRRSMEGFTDWWAGKAWYQVRTAWRRVLCVCRCERVRDRGWGCRAFPTDVIINAIILKISDVFISIIITPILIIILLSK